MADNYLPKNKTNCLDYYVQSAVRLGKYSFTWCNKNLSAKYAQFGKVQTTKNKAKSR